MLTKEFENTPYLCYPQTGRDDCRFSYAENPGRAALSGKRYITK
jgi:hypothetical protein